ncbi:leucine-rich repeat-containing protein 74B-like [Pocillopora damicornis]|uniref:leucine-rich repeat-containing protein 74B-like n=1 Tax=Pocillopora damicornis TaxID=46731 RepID=UPI000F557426|nr:leucine-rich repeat-containing protein 74B-like [Pocillopora damicornis]
MEEGSERISTPIRSPSEKDSVILSRASAASSPFGFRKAALSPPTGILRRESTGSLSPEDDFFHSAQDKEDDEGFDTDLEMEEGKEEYDVTGRATYLQACRDSGVIPVSYFHRNLQQPDIDIKHHGLGPMGAKAIAIALVTNTSVIKLNLADNWIGSEGAGYIAEMLRENCYIADLDLSENKLGADGAESVKDILLHNSNITRFVANGNGFDDKAVQILAEAIKNNTKVKYFSLSHNQLGEKGGQNLAPAIAANDKIDHLDLSWNHLRNKGACAVALSLKENFTLKILNLAWNGFGNDGSLAMGEALKVNTTLRELDLTNNRITAEGAVYLAKGLMVNTCLQVLKIGKNPMQSPGAYALVNAMKNNLESKLIEVELTDITVNNDFVELCKEVQQLRPDMKIRHGGTGGAPFKPKNRPTPMKILKNYIEDNKMRLLDLFNTLDKDKSMNITVKEFADGLKVRSLSDLFSDMDCRCILANRMTCMSKFGHVRSHSHR